MTEPRADRLARTICKNRADIAARPDPGGTPQFGGSAELLGMGIAVRRIML